VDKIKEFEEQKAAAIQKMATDKKMKALTTEWFNASCTHNYSYNYTWMGRPIIQYPQDIVAMQEIIWQVKPDLIIETGIAHGGSLILYASLLQLNGGQGEVLGIDIEIKPHNLQAIQSHPMFEKISLIEGSSIDDSIAEKVRQFASDKKSILVVLDSNHTHEHVLRELELYSSLVTKDSYLVVYDTVVEDMDENAFPNRPWGKGDNPKTAVHEFLKNNSRFEIDKNIQDKLQITVAPDGYLKCIK
jgi:cephalosporin hydroxylase